MDLLATFGGILNSILPDIQSIHVDPSISKYYQLGLLVGILFVTTLAWFPGESLGIYYGKETDEPLDTASPVSSPPADKQEDYAGRATEKPWAGDKIPKEELQRIRIKYNLTPQQMKQVMDKSRRQHATGVEERNVWRILNRLVYFISFSLMLYIFNRDYGAHSAFWFAYYFPKEARTLGIFVPEDHMDLVGS